MTEKEPGAFSIKHVKAREVLDCRGHPTLEVDVITEGGAVGRADVPSGRSTGRHETFELRDGGRRYGGMGVLRAARNVNKIIGPRLKGQDVRGQQEIDETMIRLDGTDNKSRLGGNAVVGVSLAVAKAAAQGLGVSLYRYIGGPSADLLPVPFLNLINGGKHAATDLDFQEHMVVPVGAKSFSEALRIGSEIYYELGDILSKEWGRHSLNVADEGGYTPPGMTTAQQAFDAELQAAEELGYGDRIVLGLDAAASHFYDAKKERYKLMNREISREKLLECYEELVSAYPLRSIEDPFHEEDFEAFAVITKSLKIQVVGDDLFVTNINRLKVGTEIGAANALLWKVNQVGTLTEALEAAGYASEKGYGVQVSERSGQTEDTWLADLAVGLCAGQVKTGAPCRGERTAQYNRLLRIEEELGSSAEYARPSL